MLMATKLSESGFCRTSDLGNSQSYNAIEPMLRRSSMFYLELPRTSFLSGWQDAIMQKDGGRARA